MITYWTNFAKNCESPAASAVVASELSTTAAPQMMYLAGSPKAVPLVSAEGLKALDDYYLAP